MKILNSVRNCLTYIQRNLLRCSILLVLLCTNMLVTLKFRIFSPWHLVFYHGTTSDISCLRHEGVGLPSGDFANYTERTIFFLETSCKGGIDSRQACAVESAALAHPDRKVVLMFAGPVTNVSLHSGIFSTLQSMENVEIRRIHVQDYSKGTPVEALLSGDRLTKSKHPVEHTSDILRLLTLYKFGGVYLDLDVVVLKSFDSLPKNWVAKESYNDVASGVLSFSKDEIGHNFSKLCLKELETNFNGDAWSHNGPLLIKRVLNKICSTSEVPSMNSSTCKGFNILDRKYFYPIHHSDMMQYFQPGNISSEPYTHHVWNKLTHEIKIPKHSLYASLANTFCPSIYEMYADEFGS